MFHLDDLGGPKIPMSQWVIHYSQLKEWVKTVRKWIKQLECGPIYWKMDQFVLEWTMSFFIHPSYSSNHIPLLIMSSFLPYHGEWTNLLHSGPVCFIVDLLGWLSGPICFHLCHYSYTIRHLLFTHQFISHLTQTIEGVSNLVAMPNWLILC